MYGFCTGFSGDAFVSGVSNYANDYGDGVKGTDKKSRRGRSPRRGFGKITAKQMRNAVILFSVFIVFTVLLLYKAFFPGHIQAFYVFIGLGIACIFAAIGYTVGKRPYGYMGWEMYLYLYFSDLVCNGVLLSVY